MARRKGINDRQKTIQRKYLKRKKNYLNKKMVIIIACEGSKTEKHYFKAFFDDLIKHGKLSARSYIFATHQHTNPTGVLDDLLSYQGKDGLSYKDFDQKWIVIDRDEEKFKGEGHTETDYIGAIQKSTSKNISVAYSNPSFELWYLLHFNFYNTSLDRDTANKKLKPFMSNYKKGDPSHYNQLKDKLDIAIRNAKKLDCNENCDEVRNAMKNPVTTVYRLVNKFIN